ncbi:MAG: ABC transporter permease [Chloroflexota bacterium]
MLVLVLICLLWELLPRLGVVDPLILTSASSTLVSLWRFLGTAEFLRNMQVTLFELAVAFLLSAAVGLSAGVLLGSVRFLHHIFEPLIFAFFAVPSIILYPLFFLVLGLGPASKIAFAATYAVFPILLNTVAGFRDLDTALVTAAVSMGASTWQLMSRVIFRAILPSVLAGLRIGLNLALTGVIAGEILAAQAGLGYLIRQAGTTFDTNGLLGLVLIVLAIAVASHSGLSWIERKLAIPGLAQGLS